MEKINTAIKQIIIAIIACYRWLISPLMAPRCRFYPSCSHYCQQAIAKYGFLAGGRLALWRLLRCQPLSKGGIDFVPKSLNKEE